MRRGGSELSGLGLGLGLRQWGKAEEVAVGLGNDDNLARVWHRWEKGRFDFVFFIIVKFRTVTLNFHLFHILNNFF